VILVDYYDNVDYYELNLTDWKNGELANNQQWQLNHFKFKLKPLYKRSKPFKTVGLTSDRKFKYSMDNQSRLIKADAKFLSFLLVISNRITSFIKSLF
jgi:hypothetical protein